MAMSNVNHSVISQNQTQYLKFSSSQLKLVLMMINLKNAPLRFCLHQKMQYTAAVLLRQQGCVQIWLGRTLILNELQSSDYSAHHYYYYCIVPAKEYLFLLQGVRFKSSHQWQIELHVFNQTGLINCQQVRATKSNNYTFHH